MPHVSARRRRPCRKPLWLGRLSHTSRSVWRFRPTHRVPRVRLIPSASSSRPIRYVPAARMPLLRLLLRPPRARQLGQTIPHACPILPMRRASAARSCRHHRHRLPHRRPSRQSTPGYLLTHSRAGRTSTTCRRLTTRRTFPRAWVWGVIWAQAWPVMWAQACQAMPERDRSAARPGYPPGRPLTG
jgi:hypothetical protein